MQRSRGNLLAAVAISAGFVALGVVLAVSTLNAEIPTEPDGQYGAMGPLVAIGKGLVGVVGVVASLGVAAAVGLVGLVGLASGLRGLWRLRRGV